jgi:hypothetical protein
MNLKEFCQCSLGVDLTNAELRVIELSCLIHMYAESCEEGRSNLQGAIEAITGQPIDVLELLADAKDRGYGHLYNVYDDYEYRMAQGDELSPREILECSIVRAAMAEHVDDFTYGVEHAGFDVEAE